MHKQSSKVAIAISSFYFSTVIASLVIFIATVTDTAMSGIFLVFVTMPWSLLVIKIQESLAFDSMIVITLFLLTGGLLNTYLLYKFVTFIIYDVNCTSFFPDVTFLILSILIFTSFPNILDLLKEFYF